MLQGDFKDAVKLNEPVVEVVLYAAADLNTRAKMDRLMETIRQAPDSFGCGCLSQLEKISTEVQRLQDCKFAAREGAWIKDMRTLQDQRMRAQTELALHLSAGKEFLKRHSDKDFNNRMVTLEEIFRQADKLLKHAAYAIARVQRKLGSGMTSALKSDLRS